MWICEAIISVEFGIPDPCGKDANQTRGGQFVCDQHAYEYDAYDEWERNGGYEDMLAEQREY